MLTSLCIRGYKSLMQSADIPTGALNVLVGANASGKSTFLQSLLLLRQSVSKDGVLPALKLSGPLVEAGTAQDILNPESDYRIVFEVGVSGKKSVYEFVHDREQEAGAKSRYMHATSRFMAPPQISNRGPRFAYLNAERIGPRVTYPLPPEEFHPAGLVGMNGEYTAALLARCKGGITVRGWPAVQEAIFNAANGLDSRDLRAVLVESDGRVDLVANEVLEWIIPGARFDADEDDGTDQASLRFFRTWGSTKTSMRATHVGFGLAYTLPILAACLTSEEDALILVENPEAHLQPFSQSRVGVFLGCIAAAGRQLFVETHSDHVINGIRLAVKQRLVSADRVKINHFEKSTEKDRSVITQIDIRDSGRLSKWPPGFFDQIEKDLSRL